MHALSKIFDCLIVGGGPAGLSAALLLGRSLRHVLICDDGKPRNSASEILNGYPSRDGIKPAEFLKICKAELGRYETVVQRPRKVIGINGMEKEFEATLEDGGRVTARTVLLSSGITDELPKIEGVQQFFGKTVHTCPYCHGWELKNQPLAVVGGDQEAAELAVEILQWSNDLVLCSNGKPTWNRKAKSKLESKQIKIDERNIVAFVGNGPELTGLHFDDGAILSRSGAFFSPIQKQRTNLAVQLGCKIAQEGSIKCEEDRSTSVEGVFTAGNAGRGKQLVIVAAAEGTIAAIAINNLLIEWSVE